MAITATTKVLTLDYWKLASHLQPGDWVFDRNGNLVQVKLTQHYRADQCYEVRLKDNLTICGDKHLTMPIETRRYRNQADKYKGKLVFRSAIDYWTVEKLSQIPLSKDNMWGLYSIPTTNSLQLPHQDLPVHPFVFGFWFFNRKKHGRIMPPKDYLDVVIDKTKDCGYKVTKHNQGDIHRANIKLQPTVESQLVPNIPLKIPNNFLLSSTEQRIDLLRGILYAKPFQYNEKTDTFRISSKSHAIILQIQFLLESLGHRIIPYFFERDKTYTIFFKSRLPLMHHQKQQPFRLHMARRYVKQITEIEPQMCVHIKTTAQDSTILVGEGFIACR